MDKIEASDIQKKQPSTSKEIDTSLVRPVDRPRISFVPFILLPLLFFSICIIGILLYQNQTLRSELTNNQVIKISNKTETVTPLPTVSVSRDAWREIKRQLWSFQVPSNWHYLECSDELIFAGPSLEKDQTTDCAFDGAPGLITFGRRTNAQRSIPNVNSTEPIVTQRTTIQVGGKSAVMQMEEITDGQGMGKRWVVYVSSLTYVDVITLNNIEEKEIFNQILKTIVFTGKNPRISPTQAPVSTVLEGTNCPVTFTIPPGNSQNWYIRDDYGRFTYIPRAEEFEGKTTSLAINTGQGEVGIQIGCQENLNKWNMNDFKQYILRADDMKDQSIKEVRLWNHDVYELTFSTTSKTDPEIIRVWLFSTPTTLISVTRIRGNNEKGYTTDIDDMIRTGISFKI